MRSEDGYVYGYLKEIITDEMEKVSGGHAATKYIRSTGAIKPVPGRRSVWEVSDEVFTARQLTSGRKRALAQQKHSEEKRLEKYKDHTNSSQQLRDLEELLNLALVDIDDLRKRVMGLEAFLPMEES
jgi:hypothetical protein